MEETETAAPITFQLEAWVDNWFAAYLGEELIVEDSVSITTERSFNAETAVFEASYPLTLNFILKDFKENDTGLEYLDKSCENESNPVAGTAPCTFTDLGEPDGWKDADCDDSSRTATTVQSASDVSPKDGYNQINWDASAELIWEPDLETNNTILCRVTVDAP